MIGTHLVWGCSMSDNDKAVRAWLSARGKRFEGDVPSSESEAGLRFVCTRIAGNCEINGKDCAHRHLLALKRHSADIAGVARFSFEPLVHLSPRCDRTCAECPAGAARVQLLEIGPINWRRRIIAGSSSRKKKQSKKDTPPEVIVQRIGCETFTSIEVARELVLTKWSAAKYLAHWHKLGRIKVVGKRKRWRLYSLSR